MTIHIDICMCTYRRPEILHALQSLTCQYLPNNISIRVIVVDNDKTDSARELVENYAAASELKIRYIHAPKQNISIARNASLDHADVNVDWLAFIDDDEIASPDWLMNLVNCAEKTGADVIFGPAYAQYPNSTPNWIREGNYHSNIPISRNGVVQTGHTCNALVNWKREDFRKQRFLLEKGRSGGEDTEFFFRLWRMGAKMEICEDAVVYEPVGPERLNFNWIKKRKFRSGQSYAYHSTTDFTLLIRSRLGIVSVCKVLYCFVGALLKRGDETASKYWHLRAHFHRGVLAGVLNLSEKELY